MYNFSTATYSLFCKESKICSLICIIVKKIMKDCWASASLILSLLIAKWQNVVIIVADKEWIFSLERRSLKYCQVADISLGLPKWVPFLSGSWLRINRPARVPSWLRGIKGGRRAALILLSSICNHPELCRAASRRYLAGVMFCYIYPRFNSQIIEVHFCLL